MVNDRRISNMNNVVAEIITIPPYKEIHKDLEKKGNKYPSKAILSLQTPGTSNQ
jgi:hypothetical protein